MGPIFVGLGLGWNQQLPEAVFMKGCGKPGLGGLIP
jgi:hypothetical protein